jgi:hypothetical protein
MRRGRHRGDFLEQTQVRRLAAEIIIADQDAEGVATERAVLLFVNLFEQRAGVDVDSLFQVVLEVLL